MTTETIDNNHNDSDIKVAFFATLYNVSIIDMKNDLALIRKQFYAGDISGAVAQGEEFGRVVKVCESLFDEEDWKFRIRKNQ